MKSLTRESNKPFAWPKLKQTVKYFVAQCSTCQQAKSEKVAYPGLLAPLPIPDGAWHTITHNFIEGLPRSASSSCILVVVDKFSKYAHFIPLSHPFTALQVAIIYMNNVFKLRGPPTTMVSDRDNIFTSTVWQELFELVGTDLRMSTPYHPQTYGQTEMVNQCIETYLYRFCTLAQRNGQTDYYWLNSGTIPRSTPWERVQFWCSMDMSPGTSVLISLNRAMF